MLNVTPQIARETCIVKFTCLQLLEIGDLLLSNKFWFIKISRIATLTQVPTCYGNRYVDGDSYKPKLMAYFSIKNLLMVEKK